MFYRRVKEDDHGPKSMIFKTLGTLLKQFIFLNLDDPRSTLHVTLFFSCSFSVRTSKVLNKLAQILYIQTVG